VANESVTVTIPSGTAISGPVDLGNNCERIGVLMDAAWTTAAITFQVSVGSGGPWRSLYDDAGAEVQITSANAVAGRAISLATTQLQAVLAPWRHIKLRSGSAATPVNQAADRKLVIAVERVPQERRRWPS
jgi:hypothetical protein